MKGRATSRDIRRKDKESFQSTDIGNGVVERIAIPWCREYAFSVTGSKVYTIDEVAEMLKVGRRTIEGHLYEKGI